MQDERSILDIFNDLKRDEERITQNAKICSKILKYLQKNPTQRFMQALINLGIVECVNSEYSGFNEEPEVTLERMERTKERLK